MEKKRKMLSRNNTGIYKIDEGRIIDVVRFKIKNNENISKLLEKTNKHLLKQSTKIIDKLCKNPSILQNLVRKFINTKWTRKMKKKEYLDKFYQISIKTNKKDFYKKIRCTNTEKYKPYVVLFGKTFLLK